MTPLESFFASVLIVMLLVLAVVFYVVWRSRCRMDDAAAKMAREAGE